MRNKSIWIMGVVAVVLVALAAVIVVVVLNSKKTKAPESNTQATSDSVGQTYTPLKACDVLPLDLAKTVFPGVQANDTPASDVSSGSIIVSNCNYYDATAKVSIGLLVRGAKDDAGAQTNKAQFDTLPSGAQPVNGYGDKAYWDANFGQLNILKNHNWYILSNGPVTPTSRTLDDAKKLADIIIDKL